jgi:hypothetical protein
MSSTNFSTPNTEKEKILEICTKLYTEEKRDDVLLTTSSVTESYYVNRSDIRLFESELLDYEFSTPVELKTLLKIMWEYQGNDYMKEFAVAATVAAFKNKSEDSADTKGIPSFIYNF